MFPYRTKNEACEYDLILYYQMLFFITYYCLRYLIAGVNIILVEIIVNTAVQDLNRKCGKEARRALNLCVNVIL